MCNYVITSNLTRMTVMNHDTGEFHCIEAIERQPMLTFTNWLKCHVKGGDNIKIEQSFMWGSGSQTYRSQFNRFNIDHNLHWCQFRLLEALININANVYIAISPLWHNELISGYNDLSVTERYKAVRALCGLSNDELNALNRINKGFKQHIAHCAALGKSKSFVHVTNIQRVRDLNDKLQKCIFVPAYHGDTYIPNTAYLKQYFNIITL